jgi:endonuclease/exonuclease/phosphatase family metal-dependent hydrolase
VNGIPLRVLSYNVHGLRDDRDALATLVRAAAPDVAILQEAPRRLRWRTRCAQLASALGLVHAAGGEPSVGNVIMTSLRVRVRETASVTFPLTPGRHLRGAVLARCSVPGATFTVAGAHLSLHAGERAGQAERLRKALAGFAVPEAPVLLGADLNEPPGGVVWGALAPVPDGLVDAGAAAAAATYPAAAPHTRLDALLVDARVRVLDYRVLAGPAAVRASDHLPILADLALPSG